MKNTWQEEELRNQLNQIKQDALGDSKTIFLSNPIQRKELDKVIKGYIYPAIVRATKDSPVCLSSINDGNPLESIEEEKHVHTTKSLTFLIEDPERPLIPQNNIRWFCRGKVECSVVNYMIQFDFNIYFPDFFSVTKLLKLVKDPAFEGLPPNLSYQFGVYSVEFSKGNGKDWGLSDFTEAGNHASLEIKKMLNVIYALNDLEVDYKSTKLFNDVHKTLKEAFKSN